MAPALLSYLQALWPFSALVREEDDLRASARLVRALSVPEETKQFVFALREPPRDRDGGGGVIYILAVQNLSEQSALDAERLTREVRPGAVITQVSRVALDDVRIEEDCLSGSAGGGVLVPASPFQVIKRRVTEKRSKDRYVKAAACQVLQEIFGVGFYGHLLAAKRAAEETGSCFLLLESPYERNCRGSGAGSRDNATNDSSAQQLQASCSLPHSSTADDESAQQLHATCSLPCSTTDAESGLEASRLVPRNATSIITQSTDFAELVSQQPWLLTTKLVVKPDMLFGKRGKSGLVALNLNFDRVKEFVKERLGVEVEMSGCKAPITTFIVEPFVPHDQEYYLSIVSERLGSTISFSECGGIEIEENWDKVKTVFLPTEKPMTQDACAPLIATLPLEARGKIGEFIKGVFAVFQDLDFSFLEMNPFTMMNGEPYPLDMRGELDDTAAFKNFKKWGAIEFPLPFGRVLSATESFIHELDEKTSASLKFTVLNPKGRIWTMVAGGGASVIYADTVGDLGYASELGNYAEYSGAPNEEEVLHYARVVLDCATADPDGRKRALLIGGGIANFTDVAATFNGIIRALREKESKLKASRMHIYVRRGGPNYQTGLAKMRKLGAELGVPIEVYGPEATMTGICKQAIECVMAAA